MNRRRIVAGFGTGLALAVFPPVSPLRSSADMEKLEDLRSKYPTPPFPLQSQPWPGLQSKMTPVPDCGEKRYKDQASRNSLIFWRF